jgi:hypothetical protein
MKPLNKNNDFVNFIFEGSFTFVGGLRMVQKLFDEYVGSCTVYGVRPDGTRAVIDSKI